MTILRFRHDTTGGLTLNDIFLSNLVLMTGSCFFILKFCIFALWYRCTEDGNVLERTTCVFWLR